MSETEVLTATGSTAITGPDGKQTGMPLMEEIEKIGTSAEETKIVIKLGTDEREAATVGVAVIEESGAVATEMEELRRKQRIERNNAVKAEVEGNLYPVYNMIT